MCSLFCCLSKTLKGNDDSVDCESIQTAAGKLLPRENFESDFDNGDHFDSNKEVYDANSVTLEKEPAGIQTFNETTDRSVTCTLDNNKCRTWSSVDGQRSPPQIDAENLESTSIPSLEPIYPERVFVDNENPPLESEVVAGLFHPREERTRDTNCDNLSFHITNLFRRMIRPSRWPRTASEETAGITLSTLEDKHLKRFRRHRVHQHSRGKACGNTSPSKEVLPLKISENSEVPSSETNLPGSCPAESDLNKKPQLPNDLGNSRGGQGDAFRIPKHVMYAPTDPEKRHLEPQVFPVFSWSVPVYRTRLEDGVSFSFGSGSAQPGTSSERQQSAQVMPTPALFSTSAGTGTCPSNPTPMEVDDPSPPDGSLLNQLVQLTNTSPVDSQQMVQQLKEDMQKQLELQIQLQQQVIQQEVEARLRQLGAAPASEATPKERVMFCEWTLVLRYPVDRKVADRPMGLLGYEPLRNYTLKERSGKDHHDTDQNNWPDSPNAPNPDPAPEFPNYKPVPLCSQPDPGKNDPPHECPKPDPVKSERTTVCPRQDPVECDPASESHLKDTVISEPTEVCPIPHSKNGGPSPQSGLVKNKSETGSTQTCPVKSKPAQVCYQPEPVKYKPEQIYPQPDPVGSEPPHLDPKQSEPAQVCPQLDPGQSGPAQVCPQPDPEQSEPAQLCPEPDPEPSEPAQEYPQTDPEQSEPMQSCPLPDPVLQPNPESEPDPTQPHSVNSELASHGPNEYPDDCMFPCSSQKPGSSNVDPKGSESSQACQVGDDEPENQGTRTTLSERTIFIKKPKKKHVTIKQEELDDNYDVF